MVPKKTFFYTESFGLGDESSPVFSFTASSLSYAKLYATRRTSHRKPYILLGDQIDPVTLKITNIVAVRHEKRGWRETFGKENPYAF